LGTTIILPVIWLYRSHFSFAKNGYGFYCESGNLEMINSQISSLSTDLDLVKSMGRLGYQYLINNFTVDKSYSIIKSCLK
jgi:hypothetical protein